MPSPFTDPTTLKASYSWCRTLCRRSGSSFFSSFGLLDHPRRNAMYALYAFARITDDLADSGSTKSLRRQQLSDWRKKTRAALSSETLEGNPRPGERIAESQLLDQYANLWQALQDSVQRFHIPHKLLDEVIVGVSMDIDHHAPRDWEELKDYCYHVASAVGIACTYIWRSGEAIPLENAIDCGTAFQLTNILRDVAEDARCGRVYIPLSELARHEVDCDAWLSGKPNGHWLALIEEVGREAYRCYESGWSTVDSLTPESQRMFSLMWNSYRRLLDQVLQEKSNLWQGRKPRLSRTTKLRLLAQHMVPGLFRSPQLSRRTQL